MPPFPSVPVLPIIRRGMRHACPTTAESIRHQSREARSAVAQAALACRDTLCLLHPYPCLNRMAHPPRIPVLLDAAAPVIYFLTLCVHPRQPVLANDRCWEAIQSASTRLDRWHTLSILAMPDHLHALVAPNNRLESPARYSSWLKRWVRSELGAQWRWQPGCFDRLLRSDESAQEKWLYIRENPVTAGLVKHWQEWPYQSGFREIPKDL